MHIKKLYKTKIFPILILLVIIIPPNSLNGQKHANIWYFGYGAGIDFNSGVAKPVSDGIIHTDEGSAVICNNEGELVAYSDGIVIRNANHEIVINGSGLTGTKTTTHSALFVPFPSHDNQYYVFTLTPAFSSTQGVSYSILDMNDDIGVVSEKNTFLTAMSYEKIIATPHYNGIDYWIIIPIWGDNLFKTYILSSEGLSEGTNINEGPIHQGTRQYGESIMSPGNNWFCIINHYIHGSDLYKFDNQNGNIFHIASLPLTGFYYGIEFSPDETKLYISGHDNTKSVLYQYDISDEDSIVIKSSAQLVGTVSNRHFGALKLGPDGRIYATKHTNFNGDKYLGVIYNPNKKGIECNFVEDAF